MTTATSSTSQLKFLEDRWDQKAAAGLDEPELLRYRSNLLGSDLRITNFAGGNTSSKVTEIDPLNGEQVEVLWVKGSGGDLGSIKRAGFATLYQEKLLALEKVYKGIAHEDDMVALFPLCAFNGNPTAASIDTPMHGFLPFKHVDQRSRCATEKTPTSAPPFTLTAPASASPARASYRARNSASTTWSTSTPAGS
jgi:rhamnose utilization protein RhaD (predicted bifunctional aldolase and dehydrogenase)